MISEELFNRKISTSVSKLKFLTNENKLGLEYVSVVQGPIVARVLHDNISKIEKGKKLKRVTYLLAPNLLGF